MKLNRSLLTSSLKFLLAFTLLVILWGAWVRISHSGDGCGNDWPLCKGQLTPEGPHQKTFIEYAHRITSGLFGVLVFGLFLLTQKLQLGRQVQRASSLSLFFMITEALLGAGLVKFGLVTHNDSAFRALAMNLHLINSLCLVACISLWLDFSTAPNWNLHIQNIIKIPQLSLFRVTLTLSLALVLIASTGSIAALSSTLFPASSLLDGLREDFSQNSHYLVRARFLHPVIAIFVGFFLLVFLKLIGEHLERPADFESGKFEARKRILIFAIMGAIGVGAINLLSLSPTYMKLTHLLMTYVVWTSFVFWIRTLIWGEPKTQARVF